jgi:hypothetical protein
MGTPPVTYSTRKVLIRAASNCSSISAEGAMFNQHAKWLEAPNEVAWRAKVASLSLLITALVSNRPSEVCG